MLSVFFGSDRASVVDAAQQLVQAVDTVTTIDEQNFMSGQLTEFAGSESLFNDRLAYLIDTPSSSLDFFAECMAALPELSESPHQFVVIEGTLLAADKKQYAAYAKKFEEFKADKADRFNTFALADALCKKDKRTMWVIVQEARLLGFSDEELIGILWWQLKTLRLATITNSAEAAGMKPFPYQKAQRALKSFSDSDLHTLSSSLLRVYHEGHKGVRDLALGLEKWILTLS